MEELKMKDEMNVDIELCSTKYCRKLFKCGNQKILELFHRPDFPSIKIGRAFFVKKSALEEYLNHRHVF